MPLRLKVTYTKRDHLKFKRNLKINRKFIGITFQLVALFERACNNFSGNFVGNSLTFLRIREMARYVKIMFICQ